MGPAMYCGLLFLGIIVGGNAGRAKESVDTQMVPQALKALKETMFNAAPGNLYSQAKTEMPIDVSPLDDDSPEDSDVKKDVSTAQSDKSADEQIVEQGSDDAIQSKFAEGPLTFVKLKNAEVEKTYGTDPSVQGIRVSVQPFPDCFGVVTMSVANAVLLGKSIKKDRVQWYCESLAQGLTREQYIAKVPSKDIEELGCSGALLSVSDEKRCSDLDGGELGKAEQMVKKVVEEMAEPVSDEMIELKTEMMTLLTSMKMQMMELKMKAMFAA